MYDVIIIGSGPAGLTAGLYTGRAKLKTLIFESAIIGGNAVITDQIDNYPGFPFGITGADLIENFRKQTERFDVEFSMDEVIAIEDEGEHKKIITDSGEYLAKAIIIATGAKRKELEVKGEKDFLGRGVSYCATCDGAFFQNYPVAVVGGGDSAVKEALYLADIASKVYLIHRREQFRANQTSLDKMFEHENIELKLNKVVRSIEGDSIMRRLVIEDTNTSEQERLDVEGLFVSIGLVANSFFIEDMLETREGYILTDENMQTSIQGIYAAGDIRYKTVKQVATAVGDGAHAGMAVTEYLKE
ncbi:Thioredoxin reductase [Candidatus Syntrophocurvum alkaliphilum]|uniref:Thioredoxin reductase n=1 Tax=Candidatus Syntrophocurvum alkaliphilum TaxID=2293317 RepID=A0A6I6DDS8_9FIRM|nr:thioredoxin-disulfide reductase [Candidatus Syntrophocurvum alkaliphilum]QGU00652.1 Thioredoxin reductase [Candidatus Syntrophocurvum alkaliphilum]